MQLFTRIFFFVLFIFSVHSGFAQFTVAPNQTATVLANTLAGTGVTILSPTLTCPGIANGTFTNSGTLISMNNGILLTCGHAAAVAGPYGPPPGTASFNLSAPGDPALTAILGGSNTYDACVLQFDLVAAGDSIGFNYQFGSQEYYSAVCSHYNDLFAFFISGPGIVGSPNIALVPGTNIPVQINSVNNGVPGPSGGVLSNCTSLGVGSPFTSYYIDNIGGTQLAYAGFTTKFRAVHSVTPCDTYHLKLAIADAGNAIYDSGVFLEGGSLNTNSYSFNHNDSIGAMIAGSAHTIVKGCAPTTVTILSTKILSYPVTMHFVFTGTGIHSIDYSAPDSVVLPAGSDSTVISIAGLPTPPVGMRSVKMYLYSSAACGLLDSVQLNIMDSPTVNMLTPDTSVCAGVAFQIHAAGSAGLTYSWMPIAGLSDATLLQPTVTPAVATTYTLTATLPGSGCPALTRSISIGTDSISITMLSPDTVICQGRSVRIKISGADSLSYLWSPIAGIDSIHIKDPLATPDTTTRYTVTASSTGGCTVSRQIRISVVSISANITNPDTAICRGAQVQVRATGDPTISYQWLPTAGIPNSTWLNPLITPDTSATYYLTGALPGCTAVLDSIKIDVQPHPVVGIGGRLSLCQGDTVHLHTLVSPGWYTHYLFHWSPATFLDDTTASLAVFTAGSGSRIYLQVATPAGCHSSDSVYLTVHSIAPDSLTNALICPGDSLQLHPHTGLAGYHWSPGIYLSDSTSGNPWLHAITSQQYRLIEYNQYGCRDTVAFQVTVKPAAVVNVGDSVTLHPGETYLINTLTNCTSFAWFPPAGLSNPHIANPLASPEISTRYTVTATTEWGCTAVDSIDINIDQETVLALPNAFAPGNGPNNVLRIIKRGQATLQYFRIFNRWGNLVYESSDIDQGWDGAYNGTPQPYGVFVYQIEARTITGRVFHKQGNVTLVR